MRVRKDWKSKLIISERKLQLLKKLQSISQCPSKQFSKTLHSLKGITYGEAWKGAKNLAKAAPIVIFYMACNYGGDE